MNKYVVEIFSQKRRLLTFILILILVNIVLMVVLSSYILPSLAGLHTNWNALRRQNTTKGKVDAVSLYKQGSVDLEKLQTLIPAKRQFPKVLNELFESAESCAVEVGKISYKPLQIKEEALLSYQIALSVSGRYAGIKSFLSDLQSKQELLVINSVVFSNSDLFIENVTLELNITIYLREGA